MTSPPPPTLANPFRMRAEAKSPTPPSSSFPPVTPGTVSGDAVLSACPRYEAPTDWIELKPSQLTSPLWYAADSSGDFGANTDFGFGWGPLEVLRYSRYEVPRKRKGAFPLLMRELHIRVNGKTRLAVHISDNGRALHVYRSTREGLVEMKIPVPERDTETDN